MRFFSYGTFIGIFIAFFWFCCTEECETLNPPAKGGRRSIYFTLKYEPHGRQKLKPARIPLQHRWTQSANITILERLLEPNENEDNIMLKKRLRNIKHLMIYNHCWIQEDLDAQRILFEAGREGCIQEFDAALKGYMPICKLSYLNRTAPYIFVDGIVSRLNWDFDPGFNLTDGFLQMALIKSTVVDREVWFTPIIINGSYFTPGVYYIEQRHRLKKPEREKLFVEIYKIFAAEISDAQQMIWLYGQTGHPFEILKPPLSAQVRMRRPWWRVKYGFKERKFVLNTLPPDPTENLFEFQQLMKVVPRKYIKVKLLKIKSFIKRKRNRIWLLGHPKAWVSMYKALRKGRIEYYNLITQHCVEIIQLERHVAYWFVDGLINRFNGNDITCMTLEQEDSHGIQSLAARITAADPTLWFVGHEAENALNYFFSEMDHLKHRLHPMFYDIGRALEEEIERARGQIKFLSSYGFYDITRTAETLHLPLSMLKGF